MKINRVLEREAASFQFFKGRRETMTTIMHDERNVAKKSAISSFTKLRGPIQLKQYHRDKC